jgi:hypothetical protein
MSRRSTLLVLVLAGCCAPSEHPATSTIQGTVRFVGVPPKPRTFNLSGFPAGPRGGIPREDLVLDEAGGVKGALVYVAAGLERAPVSPPATPIVMEVNDLRYSPHVLALQVGQELMVHNRDSAFHHPHVIAEKNPLAMFGFPGGGSNRLTFTHPEIPVRLLCDVHPWMKAYVAVLDHPYFAMTDERGRFEIPGLAAGRYTLRLWHEKLKADDLEIEVKDGLKADFNVK